MKQMFSLVAFTAQSVKLLNGRELRVKLPVISYLLEFTPLLTLLLWLWLYNSISILLNFGLCLNHFMVS